MGKPTANAAALAHCAHHTAPRGLRSLPRARTAALCRPSLLGAALSRDLPPLEPRHHGPQLVANLLDLVAQRGLPHLHELLPAGVVLAHPALGEAPALDVLQDLMHRLAHAVVDDLGAADVVAVLGGVADRVAHVLDATLIHQVDDQLQLVE